MLTVDNNKKFDWKSISLEDCLNGNAIDAHYTAKVYCHLLKELSAKSLEKLYENLISPATVIFRDLEFDGLLIDQDKLKELKAAILEKLNSLSENMMKSAFLPENVNFNSSQDLIKILYSLEKNDEKEWAVSDSFGFGLYPFSRTDKGQPKTDEETLIQLKELVDKEMHRRSNAV